MWETTRPWEEEWETLKVNEGNVEEQGIDDEDRRHRPDVRTGSQSMKRSTIYILEFKRVTDTSAPCHNTRS